MLDTHQPLVTINLHSSLGNKADPTVAAQVRAMLPQRKPILTRFLIARISTMLRRMKNVRNLITPVNQLPPEILAHIAVFFPRERDLINATAVCHRWCTILLSFPRLWPSAGGLSMDVLQTYLERSKSIPLSASLSCPELTDLVIPHTSRLTGLAIQLDRPLGFREIMHRLPHPVPTLRTFCISDDHRHHLEPPLRFSRAFLFTFEETGTEGIALFNGSWQQVFPRMALFFQPPPPPSAPNGITLPPGADCDSYEQWIFKPLESALSSMAQSLQDLNDDPNPSHSHYLLSRFLAIVGDEAHKPIWPVLYPSSNFEDTLIGQIQSIHAEIRNLPAPNHPVATSPNPLDITPVVAAVEKGFEALKRDNATSLKTFADAVKQSAPPPPPPKPKPKQDQPPSPKKFSLPQAVIRFKSHVDPQSRPSFTDLVNTINTNLICDNHYSHVCVVGVKWTASANLLVRAHAPSPTELVDTLESATKLMTFPAYIKDIIPNVRWSCVVLSNVFTGKAPDSPAHPPHIIHHELSTANPEYKNLIIRQFPAWLRNPDSLKDNQLSSISFAFEDPDRSLSRRLIGSSLTAFGNLRCQVKAWAPPKKTPQVN